MFALNNKDFETTFLVSMSLQQFAIERLEEIWKDLDRQTEKSWKKLKEFTNTIGNCKHYRKFLKQEIASGNKNIVPYMALYLKDLTFIEDGNNNYAMAGIINFQKMRMIADVVTQIQLFQQAKFTFKKNVKLMVYMMHGAPAWDEDTLYAKSKIFEPVKGMSTPTKVVQEKEIVVKNPLFGVKLPPKKTRK